MKPRYDTTQLKSHPKRNRKQNEMLKEVIYKLDLMLGENHAGEVICILADSLNKMLKEKTPSERIELRSLEIKLNDYFSLKYDFKKGGYVE